MKATVKERSNLIAIAALCLSALALLIFFSLATSDTASAGERVSYEGSIRGATCTHYKQECFNDDAHIAMEQDFVLVMPDEKHYFLPNLNRAIKARYVGMPVRIAGDREDHEIWVDSLEVKKGQEFRRVWSWSEQQKLYEKAGG